MIKYIYTIKGENNEKEFFIRPYKDFYGLSSSCYTLH